MIIAKSLQSSNSNHSADTRHKQSQQQPQLRDITELPTVPKQPQKSQGFCLRVLCKRKFEVFHTSSTSVVCYLLFWRTC